MKSRHCQYKKYTLCNFCRHLNECMGANYEMYTKVGNKKVILGHCEEI